MHLKEKASELIFACIRRIEYSHCLKFKITKQNKMHPHTHILMMCAGIIYRKFYFVNTSESLKMQFKQIGLYIECIV